VDFLSDHFGENGKTRASILVLKVNLVMFKFPDVYRVLVRQTQSLYRDKVAFRYNNYTQLKPSASLL